MSDVEPDFSAIPYQVHKHAPTPEDLDRGEIRYRPDGTFDVIPRPLTAAQRLEAERRQAELERLREQSRMQFEVDWSRAVGAVYRPPTAG